MDDYQLNRQKAFAPYVKRESRGMEIGPGYRPTFSKADGYAVTIVDHCSTEELIAKYTADTYVPQELVQQIETVDVVWTEGSYQNLIGMSGGLDYIAASHVIEHTTDVCGFLKDCSAMLKDGGYLLLAIPDRRCVLDCCRPPSTVGDVLLAHLVPQAYDIKSRLDEAWYGALLDGGGAWSMEHLRHATSAGRMPTPQHDISFAGAVWMQSNTVLQGVPGVYRDAHRWVFDPTNFKEISSFLASYAQTDLRIEAMPVGYGCEFYAVLKKTKNQNTTTLNGLSDIRLHAMRARLLNAESRCDVATTFNDACV